MNRKQVSNNLDDYVEYLCKEFEKYGSKNMFKERKLLLYFGGGTPTIYKEYQLEKYYPLLLTVLIFLLIANLHLKLLFII